MKKILVLVLALFMLCSLCACGTVECDVCGEQVSSFNATEEELFGQTVYICDDCNEDLNNLYDLFS